MSKYVFVSEKIKIGPEDCEIKEKGGLKVVTLANKTKVLRGSGIYDKKAFVELNKNRKSGKILESKDGVNFYTLLNAPSPSIVTDYTIFGKNKAIVQDFLEYKKVYNDGEIVNFSDIKELSSVEDDKFMYGEEAARFFLSDSLSRKRISQESKDEMLKSFDEWFKLNNSRIFLISDYSLREPKLLNNGKKLILGEINSLYEELFDANEYNSIFLKDDIKPIFDDEDEFDELSDDFLDSEDSEDDEISDLELSKETYSYPKMVKFLSSKKIFDARRNVDKSLFNYTSIGKKSVVKKEGISEKLSGAVRGTIVPDPFISEDTIEVGTAFADVLFPEFVGLWNNADELNYLLSRGVLRLDKEIFRYDPTKFMKEEELLYYKTEKDSIRWERMNYFYPWFEEKYDFIPKENLVEIKEEINQRRMEFYNTHQSDIPYHVFVNRPPTICQLSALVMRPIFRNSIGINGMTNEKSKFLYGITAPYNKNDMYDSLDEDVEIEDNDNFDEDEDSEDETENAAVRFMDEDNLETVYFEDVLAVNPLTCDGMNSDFDGDLLLLIGLYTEDANIEAQELLSSKNYKTLADGNLRNAIPKEFMATMKAIYKKNPELAMKIHNVITGE